MTTLRRTARTAAVTVAIAVAALVPVGVAAAAPTPAPVAVGDTATSGVSATVSPADSSAGHQHFTVVLTAAPGTAPQTLVGWPDLVGAAEHGAPRPVTIAHYGESAHPVVLAPGSPVQFDIQVPNLEPPATADEVTFTLPGQFAPVPGLFTAHGQLAVADGMATGPLQPLS